MISIIKQPVACLITIYISFTTTTLILGQSSEFFNKNVDPEKGIYPFFGKPEELGPEEGQNNWAQIVWVDGRVHQKQGMTYFKAQPHRVNMIPNGMPNEASRPIQKVVKFNDVSSDSGPSPSPDTPAESKENSKVLKFGSPRKRDNRTCGLVTPADKMDDSGYLKGPKIGKSDTQRLAIAAPWAAAVISGNQITCSATIIGDRWLISANKCFLNETSQEKMDPKYYRIGYGSANASANNEAAIEKIVYHEDQKGHVTGNDIAMIKLKEPLNLLAQEDDQYTNNAICLPRYKGALTKVKTYAWGFRRADKTREKPVLLVETKMKVASDSECGSLYTSKLFSGGIIPMAPPEDVLCAYAESTEGCAADRGAALVHVVKGHTVLAGVSFQMGCSIEDKMIAGIYSNVYAYKSWINRVMNNDHN